MIDRRSLLQHSAALLALAALPGRAEVQPARRPLDLLFLGGTGFLGIHQVEYALARGHRVTLFNRGRSATQPFGGRVEVLIGDRDAQVGAGLGALAGKRRWDAVIDNSGYVPRHVGDSATLLRDRTRRYVFVSTVAVYDPAGGPNYTEASPRHAAPTPATETVDGRTYGPLKAECERIATAVLGRRLTVVRPPFVFGPGDDTDRFTYWVERVARGGEVLGPSQPDLLLNWIDARDLCPWTVQLAEQNVAGVFNAAGPVEPTTWRAVLETLAPLASQPVNFHWANAEALARHKVGLPLFSSNTRQRRYDSQPAYRAGLKPRPLADTARATLAWWREQTPERRAAAEGWPTPEQEQAVLRES
jgi:2'-hydroxyisoflavone reductase